MKPLIKGVMSIFKVTVNLNNKKFIDILLESEYFASVCGFEYPDGQLFENNKSAKLYLEAKTKKDKNNPRVKHGLMVWHNTNYIPEISLSERNDSVEFEISNEYSLPYPAIKRTEAWLMGLVDYLRSKARGDENIEKSKLVFLSNVQQKT